MYRTLEINGRLIDIDFSTDGRIMKCSNIMLSKLGMKFCCKCQSAKEFNRFTEVKGKLRPYCIDCTRAAGRETIRRKYHKTKNGIKIKRIKIRNHLSVMCGGCCVICGYNKFISALEYHHVHKPDFRIMDKVMSLVSTNGETRFRHAKSMSDELSKCILVCANCHCAIHGKQISINTASIHEKLILVSPQNLVLIAERSESNKE